MNLIKPAYAAITNPVIGLSGTASGEQTIGNIIGAIVGILLLIGFLLAFIHLILGGLRWITAGGDKNGLESAQGQITQAIVGLIIVTATWAIMLLLGSFLGIGFPKFTLPTVMNPVGTQPSPNNNTCSVGVCISGGITVCTSIGGTPTGQTCSPGTSGYCCIYPLNP